MQTWWMGQASWIRGKHWYKWKPYGSPRWKFELGLGKIQVLPILELLHDNLRAMGWSQATLWTEEAKTVCREREDETSLQSKAVTRELIACVPSKDPAITLSLVGSTSTSSLLLKLAQGVPPIAGWLWPCSPLLSPHCAEARSQLSS